jgi:Flp pilus assembly protein TadG
MMSTLMAALRRFRRSETGSFTAEFVVIFPLLVWSYTAMFVFWDAFKTQNVNLKATYTIADMISREPRTINADYIDGARTIYAALASGTQNQRVRVSLVRNCLEPDGTAALSLEWSVATAGALPYTQISQVENIVPMLAVNDKVVVVSTLTDWRPLFTAGLSAMTLSETVVTSPRLPQINFDGGSGPVPPCPP